MKPSGLKAHWREALRWSSDVDSDWVAMLGSALSMAAPILLGAVLGNLEMGFSLGFGSLLIGGVGAHASARAQMRTLVTALLPTALAAAMAVTMAGHGISGDIAIVILAGLAGVIAAMGRPITPMAIRFVLFLVLVAGLAEGRPDHVGLLLAMLAGALWSAALSLVLGAVARAYGFAGKEPSQAPALSWRERLVRWRRALGKLAGWQFALRLVVCLSIAVALRILWPAHHLQWIALTVVLLIEWQIDAFPVRTTQRALGTAIGVLVSGVLIIETPPAWALVAGMAVLAGARPLLRRRSYLAYSAVMTPLIILILDAGRTIEPGLLIDRLVATLIGAALVIGANLLLQRWLGTAETPVRG